MLKMKGDTVGLPAVTPHFCFILAMDDFEHEELIKSGFTEFDLHQFEQHMSLVDGWCKTCSRHITGNLVQAHCNSSSHRWRSRFRCREFVLQMFQARMQQGITLAEALDQTWITLPLSPSGIWVARSLSKLMCLLPRKVCWTVKNRWLNFYRYILRYSN